MTEDELFARLREPRDLMSYDYNRLSVDGKEGYAGIMFIVALLTH